VGELRVLEELCFWFKTPTAAFSTPVILINLRPILAIMSVLPKKFTVYKGSPSKEIVQDTTSRDHLDKDQVLIKVTHSGLCGSDHVLMAYPVVLGHEGIGTIAQIGSDVKDVKVGDRVGWGYQQDVRLPLLPTT
jgi:hypothetical protein